MNKKKRAWLNPLDHWDSGSILLEMSSGTQDGDHNRGQPYLNGELQIRDCYRQINLNFNCSSNKDCRARLYKVRLMREYLDALEAEVLKTQEAFTHYVPPRKPPKRRKKTRKWRDLTNKE